jgi:hypothetical protein
MGTSRWNGSCGTPGLLNEARAGLKVIWMAKPEIE